MFLPERRTEKDVKKRTGCRPLKPLMPIVSGVIFFFIFVNSYLLFYLLSYV